MTPDASTMPANAPAVMRAAIRRAGLTQEKAAQLVGIAPRTLRQYLAPDGSPPYAVVFTVQSIKPVN